MLTRLEVDGFRRLNGVDLALRPLNVLIGPNGSGKTSLLDAVWLLPTAWHGALRYWFTQNGGFAQQRTYLRCGKSNLMKFAYSAGRPPSQSMLYRIDLAERGPAYSIVAERLELQRSSEESQFSLLVRDPLEANVLLTDSKPSRIEVSSVKDESEWAESGVAWTPWARGALGDAFWGYASAIRYGLLSVVADAPVRVPRPLTSVSLPSVDGSDLASCLYTFRESHPESFEAVEASLRSAFPEFERLGFPPVAAGMIVLTWKDRTSSQPYYVNQLSEGTLRFLWLVTILTSPGLPPVTMIDEPEVSLHPRMLMILAELMREASLRTQLFVATHSATLIGFLEPKEVLAINRDEVTGNATFQWADELDLEAWLRDYDLGELWQIGQIGGR